MDADVASVSAAAVAVVVAEAAAAVVVVAREESNVGLEGASVRVLVAAVVAEVELHAHVLEPPK